MSTIKDLNLAPSGERKIRWVEAHMPVLRDIGSDFAREKPFAGLKIALSVHLEAKTAYLCRVLERSSRILSRRSSAAVRRRRPASTACGSWTVPERCVSR